MVDIYAEYGRLRNRVASNLGSIEEARKKLEKVGLKIPRHLEDKINLAQSQHAEAEKKFEEARHEVLDRGRLEAFNKMQEAANSAHTVLSEIYELYFEDFYQKACEARDSYSDYEYLASKHIPKYSEHKKSFRIIEKRRKNNEKLSWNQVSNECDWLQNFLKDFESVKEELATEIKKEKEADKKFWIGIKVAIVGIVVTLLLGVAGIVVMVRGCGDSTQQTVQPKSVGSECEITLWHLKLCTVFV